MMLLLVSIVVLAMPVVPHHHHGHQALVCMRHDLHAGCCENHLSDCVHDAGMQGPDCRRHNGMSTSCRHDGSGCCDGDDPCGHCCCHTGCVAHGVVQLAPDTDDVLPAPAEGSLALASFHVGLNSLLQAALLSATHLSAALPQKQRTTFYIYVEKLPDAPCVRAHGLRAPPMVLVG